MTIAHENMLNVRVCDMIWQHCTVDFLLEAYLQLSTQLVSRIHGYEKRIWHDNKWAFCLLFEIAAHLKISAFLLKNARKRTHAYIHDWLREDRQKKQRERIFQAKMYKKNDQIIEFIATHNTK